MKFYNHNDNQDIEEAILFMIKKITEYCSNEKPLILHCIKVGVKLMELGEKKYVVIAGLLHDLLEDTNCKEKDIEDEFGSEVLDLVKACTFNIKIEDYQERWQMSLDNIKEAGKEAFIIKLVDQMDNLPYYLAIKNGKAREILIWKHKYFIECFNKEYLNYKLFKEYKELVSKVS